MASSSESSPTARSPHTTGRHPSFHGIRSRSGKWVSEIREPRKSKRIWLGTYPTPEMAAAAYDVAALSLKGSNTLLNFPHFVERYQVPALPEPDLIRSAAGAAAILMKCSVDERVVYQAPGHDDFPVADHVINNNINYEFMDEEAFFDTPNLYADMAEGMLMSPPRQLLTTYDHSALDDSYGCDDFWVNNL
ncbi:AP2/ERF domain-containing protein [Artemisia annua]|uniref:AP2/ERF domain-containing protein n=1 Tax=Artemisia annua TaxID=35608 RepID=A0A2U1N542_ARTAN|nr:AP2/ERF domain-containing protein [Artemisia annua]